jgi:hypothetical protein
MHRARLLFVPREHDDDQLRFSHENHEEQRGWDRVADQDAAQQEESAHLQCSATQSYKRP